MMPFQAASSLLPQCQDDDKVIRSICRCYGMLVGSFTDIFVPTPTIEFWGTQLARSHEDPVHRKSADNTHLASRKYRKQLT
jgi:hypothetical protein